MAIKPAAIGLRAHSGWAALVGVAADASAMRVAARRRIEIADPAIRGSKQPYHAVEPLKSGDAAALIERCRESSRTLAREAIGAAISELGDHGYQIIGCAVLVGTPQPARPLAETLASHVRIHTAEGQFFREILIEASRELNLPVTQIGERAVYAQACAKLKFAEVALAQWVTQLGRPLGPPWTQDHKRAALAACLALAMHQPLAVGKTQAG
jgi:hypothetical protein